MQFCSLHHCVIFFLILTFPSGPVPAFNSVMVKLNQSAILPCNQNCSDSLRWTVIDEPFLNVAECNQTSCWSKEGFNMSHDQYLKGDLSLTINAADYSNRGLYTCECAGTEICRVRLIIETVMSPVHLKVGQSLDLDLSIPDPVQVTYKSTDSADPDGEVICTVIQHSLECKAEYTPRTSLRGTVLILKKVNLADCGLYLIWDKKNNEIIHIYTLYLKDVVSVKLHKSATLSCNWKCPVAAKWINKKHVTVAQCNQTLCWPSNEYVMSHDQYLEGNLSLTITTVDYNKRGWYTCQCGDRDKCHRHLMIEPVREEVQLKPAENLLMELPIPENVEVIYNQNVIYDPTSQQICILEKGSLVCKTEYTQRIKQVLKLEMNLTDSGVYIIQDMESNEVIHIYNVTVKEDQPRPDLENRFSYSSLFLGIFIGLIIAAFVFLVFIFWKVNNFRVG
ncbi:uncharacterized protein LOC132854732 [Tachysurus vachellii]|uniref:uncharacterized protein LOC132854732 n=1 Tax=Tachysurus vachellii TaxID=175792 RepID=UPI00296AC3BE|nr:uncharacterized protein LOC132854732 [Tachysurus vachellii]XP_060739300.1 uncharacterized protein LOC132854732 [Tachysurus vachellii]